MRRAKLFEHLSSAELQERYLKCQHPTDRVRWHALWLVSIGKSGNEAAQLVGRTSGWASLLVRKYNEQGEAGVVTVKREGRQWGGSEASLRWGSEEEKELREALRQKAPDGGLWTSAKVAAWLSERRGRKVHLQAGWRTLRRLRQSKQLPRPQHPEAAGREEQAAFQKKPLRP
jgi:transposase